MRVRRKSIRAASKSAGVAVPKSVWTLMTTSMRPSISKVHPARLRDPRSRSPDESPSRIWTASAKMNGMISLTPVRFSTCRARSLASSMNSSRSAWALELGFSHTHVSSARSPFQPSSSIRRRASTAGSSVSTSLDGTRVRRALTPTNRRHNGDVTATGLPGNRRRHRMAQRRMRVRRTLRC